MPSNVSASCLSTQPFQPDDQQAFPCLEANPALTLGLRLGTSLTDTERQSWCVQVELLLCRSSASTDACHTSVKEPIFIESDDIGHRVLECTTCGQKMNRDLVGASNIIRAAKHTFIHGTATILGDQDWRRTWFRALERSSRTRRSMSRLGVFGSLS